MDSSAVLWILAWSGVISVLIFVLTGILGQLLPLIEAWRKLRSTFRDDSERNRSEGSELALAQECTNAPTADPVQSETAGSAIGAERHGEADSAAPAPPSHQ
ncbi:hypothetical protein SAMN05428942_2183 [Streptomyces sp. 2112.2]|uniref:hypothetical protein n=1 Tax=Streptomyces sp. 2112.2 TaxID=1881024 RepID=UPI000896EC90|nr:hypothetical protein [Streptomyces sp. 2112.2]SED64423.1 hypothetical protein SAMN05428942_2183 [Streptomyces sp. 2112.2]